MAIYGVWNCMNSRNNPKHHSVWNVLLGGKYVLISAGGVGHAETQVTTCGWENMYDVLLMKGVSIAQRSRRPMKTVTHALVIPDMGRGMMNMPRVWPVCLAPISLDKITQNALTVGHIPSRVWIVADAFVTLVMG